MGSGAVVGAVRENTVNGSSDCNILPPDPPQYNTGAGVGSLIDGVMLVV